MERNKLDNTEGKDDKDEENANDRSYDKVDGNDNL